MPPLHGVSDATGMPKNAPDFDHTHSVDDEVSIAIAATANVESMLAHGICVAVCSV
jgi:hypothetical protein